MTEQNLNSAWGSPQIPWALDDDRTASSGLNAVSIERQLYVFIRDQILEWRPDVIVVVERKGTAILRALKDSDTLDWPWDKVISSTVVNQKPVGWFDSKRVLVFDDMMRSGDHLDQVLRELSEHGVDSSTEEHVRVAVFAVHEDSSNGRPLGGALIPHTWFYKNLSTPSYQSVRMQIIGFLQRAGSLMLDTEHIEVQVMVRGSFRQFKEALQRKADVVQFKSLNNRSNITVYYADDDVHTLPKELFPEGSQLDHIVKKCRIVQRDMDRFAIIPICFPSPPTVTSKSPLWPTRPEDVELLGDIDQLTSDEARGTATFYGAGLLAALEVLKWTLKDLSVADKAMYKLSLPSSPESLATSTSSQGYALDHLTVMYPNINISCLTERISEIVASARSEGAQLRGRRFEGHPPLQFKNTELRKDAIELLQLVRQALDNRMIDRYLLQGEEPQHPDGMTVEEIFRVVRSRGWQDAKISTLFDVLIDDAHLVTHVEPVLSEHGELLARTFEPDGEYTSGLVRRLTTQWGLPGNS